MDAPNCPSCGKPLRRMPQRPNKCPHCGDLIRWKYEPGQTRQDARLVGAVEAARIEALWLASEKAQREEAEAQTRVNIIENIRSLAQHPDVVAVRLCLSPVCSNEKCSAKRRYFSMAEALARPPIPCHEPDHCYGWIEAVFDDELTPEIYAEARIPFPTT